MPKSKTPSDKDFTIDDEQFKLMLHKMFPNTKNLDSKIREMDEIDKNIDQERCLGKEESTSGNDSDSEDSDYDDDFNNQPINIIVTLGNLDNLNDDYESSDPDYITEEEEEEEEEDDEETEEEEEDIAPDTNNATNDKPYVCKKRIKQSRKTPPITRSKTNPLQKKEKLPEKKSPMYESNKHSDKSINSSKYNDLIKSLMISLENEESSKVEKKVTDGLKEFLQLEKIEADKKEAKKIENENKNKKLKNEKKFKKLLRRRKNINSLVYFKNQDIGVQNNVITKFQEIEENNKIDKPYSFIIVESKLPITYKTIALKKLKMFEHMEPGASDYYKNKLWVDTFMEIPFSKYANLPVTLGKSSQAEIIEFMDMSMKTLDNVVYGLDDAKMQIMQIIGKWIANPDCIGNAFAINGPPGTGKTTLIKDGISKILNRPFAFIPLGGATDSSYLEGHSYTYEGSIWGKIVQILIDSKVMNPVIYFDELDKVSNSPRGEEIIGVLTHLTDTSQNSQFHDKYFSGIDFDLSKALFIFSYNDESKINPILKDRMYRINTKGYNNLDKQIISNKYILPNILRSINFKKDDIIIDNDVMDYINQNLTENEKGVRNMKRCIETICSKLNLIRLSNNPKILGDNIEIDFTLPHKVKIEEVQKLIKQTAQDFPANMYC